MTKQCFINEAKMCAKVLLCCFWETDSMGCASWEKVRDRQWQYDDKQFPLKLHYEMDVMYHDGSYDVAYRR